MVSLGMGVSRGTFRIYGVGPLGLMLLLLSVLLSRLLLGRFQLGVGQENYNGFGLPENFVEVGGFVTTCRV